MTLNKGNYIYRYCSEKADNDGVAYSHDFYIIKYFEKIDGYCTVNNSKYNVSTGDIIVIKPDEEYSVLAFNKDCCVHTIQFSKQCVNFFGVDILRYINKKPIGKLNKIELTFQNKQRVYDCFNNIRYYYNNKLPESELMIKTYIIQLVVSISEYYKNEMCVKDEYRVLNKKISSVIEYINNNIKDKISLDVVAEKFFISKYHLCHSFKEVTGYTIHNYINMQKTEFAKELLNTGMLPSEVAFECGYTDYSVFYKTFKKYIGKSPTQYMEKNKATD